MESGLKNKIISVSFRKFIDGLGWLGIFFVVYSIIAETTGQKWLIIETWGPPVSIFLTLLGTTLTAASVYFYNEIPNPPEKFSLLVSAPIVILTSSIAGVFLIIKGVLPVMLTNGFAMLGLAGALFRIQVNPGIFK